MRQTTLPLRQTASLRSTLSRCRATSTTHRCVPPTSHSGLAPQCILLVRRPYFTVPAPPCRAAPWWPRHRRTGHVICHVTFPSVVSRLVGVVLLQSARKDKLSLRFSQPTSKHYSTVRWEVKSVLHVSLAARKRTAYVFPQYFFSIQWISTVP